MTHRWNCELGTQTYSLNSAANVSDTVRDTSSCCDEDDDDVDAEDAENDSARRPDAGHGTGPGSTPSAEGSSASRPAGRPVSEHS